MVSKHLCHPTLKEKELGEKGKGENEFYAENLR
jgi:hypothetical protein